MNVTVVNGFPPSPSDTFKLLPFGSSSGTFASSTGPAGRVLTYEATDVSLSLPDGAGDAGSEAGVDAGGGIDAGGGVDASVDTGGGTDDGGSDVDATVDSGGVTPGADSGVADATLPPLSGDDAGDTDAGSSGSSSGSDDGGCSVERTGGARGGTGGAAALVGLLFVALGLPRRSNRARASS